MKKKEIVQSGGRVRSAPTAALSQRTELASAAASSLAHMDQPRPAAWGWRQDKLGGPQRCPRRLARHLHLRGRPRARPDAAPAAQVPGKEGAPNKILFVQNLPESSNASMLTMLFQQFPGLKEVRMVDARPGIAFVEFENDSQSTTAMAGLQNFIIAEKPMSLTFAKQ